MTDNFEQEVQDALGLVYTYDVFLRGTKVPWRVVVNAVNAQDAIRQAKHHMTTHKLLSKTVLTRVVYEAYLRNDS